MAKTYQDPRMRNAMGKPAWCLRWKGLDGKYHKERTDATTKEEAQALLRRKMSDKVEAQAKGLHSLDHLKPVAFETFYTEKYLPAVKARIRASTLERKTQLEKHVL